MQLLRDKPRDMFHLAVFLVCCALSGSVSADIYGDRDSDLCNASFTGKQWLSSISLSKFELRDRNYSETHPTDRRTSSIPIDPSPWAEFPLLPLVFASSDTLPEGRCKEQARRYLQHLRNSTLWAVQMFDASTKYPDGVIYGHTKHLGNFDQCYNLRAKLPPYEDDPGYQDEVEGRYCLVRFRYQRKDMVPKRPKTFTLDFDPNLSAWDAIDDRGDFRRVKRNSVYMALCVPETCSAEEVEIALKNPLKKFAEARGIRLETDVKPSLCQARRDVPNDFSTGAKIFCFIILALFVLVVGSSWYDSSLYSAEEAANEVGPKDFFLCFSARRNLRSIFAPAGSHPGLECIHLIRLFFMTGVIFGHRIMQYYGNPIVDSTYMEKAYTVPPSMMVFHGPIVVDGFFSLGGLLLAYGLLEELDRSRRMRFTALILIRFLRLTPLYMLVVFFHSTLMPMMGSGPYWESRIGSDRDNCAKNWWTNLLYVNNYVNPKELCMFQSWYLSVDYHLYIMGLFVLWTFWRMPRKFGYPFIAGFVALGIAIPFAITYAQNVQPMFLALPFMLDVRKDPFFVDHYIKSHMRIGPYMVGVLAGIIIYDHKSASWRLPKVWSRVLFILLAVGLTITSQSQGAKYYDPNSVLHPLETAAYAGFHRATFALGICSIVVLITIGDGLDFHYNFMTPRWVAPLARLTYGAFLVHNINQGYEIATTRTPRVFSAHNCFWDAVPDMVYTFALSLLLSISVEGPIRRIEKFMLTKRPSRSPTESSSSNGVKKID